MSTKGKFLMASALALILMAGACFPYHSRIPGVLDLRSDGMQAQKAPLPAEVNDSSIQGGPRQGLESFFLGKGMQTFGSKIAIEDRTYWLFWILPMFNKSVAEEISSATRGQALREVHLQQQYALNDVLIVYGSQFLNMVPVVGNVAATVAAVLTPSQTISLSGVRIQALGSASPAAATPGSAGLTTQKSPGTTDDKAAADKIPTPAASTPPVVNDKKSDEVQP